MSPKSPDEIDRGIIEAADSGWVGSINPAYTVSEESFDEMVNYFANVPDNRRTELKSALKRIYRSLVTAWHRQIVPPQKKTPPNGTSKGEREARTKNAKPSKPSTVIARDLKKLSKAAHAMIGVLEELNDPTENYIDLWLQDEKWSGAAELKIDPSTYREQLHRSLEVLVFLSRNADELAKRGPHDAALHLAVEGLANLWEEMSGKLPVSDKARENREDPFLDLCTKMVAHAKGELVHVGLASDVPSLAGLVYEVLTKMKARAKQDPRIPG
jgi:hypothetical protein